MTRRATEAAASDRVRREWLVRAETEFRSASIAHSLSGWLLALGAPFSIVRAGLRIVGDEMAHSELSYRAYRAAGGTELLHVDRSSLGLAATTDVADDALRAIVEIYCVGETVAVPLFAAIRRVATRPAARSALDRIVRDEVRHREFGWMCLDWMLSDDVSAARWRHRASEVLPACFAAVRVVYAGAAPAPAAADRVWGLIGGAEYAAAVDKTLARDWIPRFGAVGIDAKAAWSARA